MEVTSETSALAILVIGFVLGLHHAIEADHLAAVSTIVSEKKDLFTASLVGGLWGVGHTIALLCVGSLVILAKFQISESVEDGLEAEDIYDIAFQSLASMMEEAGGTLVFEGRIPEQASERYNDAKLELAVLNARP